MAEVITVPEVGRRVWTWGEKDHGPLDGPKVDIAGPQCGTIVRTEARFGSGPFGAGPTLFVVQWDNGQETKHYGSELFCIGPFQSLADFHEALATARNVEVEYGPGGGFIRGRATI